MAATYTWDVFTSLDGFGSHHGDWGGYWGKQGPELLARRLELYEQPLRMVFGAKTFRENVQMLSAAELDPWVSRMKAIPYELAYRLGGERGGAEDSGSCVEA